MHFINGIIITLHIIYGFICLIILSYHFNSVIDWIILSFYFNLVVISHLSWCFFYLLDNDRCIEYLFQLIFSNNILAFASHFSEIHLYIPIKFFEYIFIVMFFNYWNRVEYIVSKSNHNFMILFLWILCLLNVFLFI
jgi:hypothetical protein